ncbi:MAG: hypothetical protein WD380_04065 [Gaiellaceae bacterium]
MSKRLRTLPSPAIVIASLALLVALTGTSVAAISQIPRNSVGSAQLKANSVTNAKLASNSVRSAEVRNGSLLRADFGPGQIPAGPVGPQGPPGLSAREQVSIETPLSSTSPKNITATCPAGKKALGGGIELGGAGRNRVTPTENKPAGDNAWEGEAFEVVATNATWKLIVHVICATVT